MKGLRSSGAQEISPETRESSLKRHEVAGDIKNCRSIIWSVAVVLDFAKAIPTLYLFSLLPKSTK